ncbi:hypothetical protein [Desulfosporosinus meridiei]|uniref:Uncharacterized protein n=1 Tax=Desulfosporosinus meridiei (strain ATCC BAA-275 / DSM 13257 / KCTC 12902 / NCIMB 13706 / S10) TaxID=768704 RepID=J7IYV4_DESMD|nr:hypothetical protein [Desulfosporosinus meridiei]AFQ43871.1 hypothetical protein Desmer_1916 [Desulfosporosinus meridiei DSM 13257]
MDNEKFQELVLKHLEDNAKRLEGISEKLVEHGRRFDGYDERFDGYDKRFDNLETLGKQHHDELEKVASQVEKLIRNEDEITDFLLKRRRRI